MARRATVYNRTKSQTPTLILIGSNEFFTDKPQKQIHLPPVTHGKLQIIPPAPKANVKPKPDNAKGAKKNIRIDDPEAEHIKKLYTLYNLLDISAGWMSPEAAAAFKKNVHELPTGFYEVGEAPVTCITNADSTSVGIVFFPKGSQAAGAPSKQQIQQVLSAGKSLLGKVDLILGISPWGYYAEKDFLPLAEGTFSCLLGGGDDIAFPFYIDKKHPQVLWIRSDNKGRTLTEITLHSLPDNTSRFTWKEGQNFSGKHIRLEEDIAPDRRVNEILGPPPRAK